MTHYLFRCKKRNENNDMGFFHLLYVRLSNQPHWVDNPYVVNSEAIRTNGIFRGANLHISPTWSVQVWSIWCMKSKSWCSSNVTYMARDQRIQRKCECQRNTIQWEASECICVNRWDIPRVLFIMTYMCVWVLASRLAATVDQPLSPMYSTKAITKCGPFHLHRKRLRNSTGEFR